MFRVGIGQDSHKFVSIDDKKPLMMGGILIPDQLGLDGNSDSDPLLHALFNALSSAIGKDSLGTIADPMCKNQGIKDSTKYLEVVLKWINKENLKINNISFSVEAKTPRLPLKTIRQIQQNIGGLCAIPINSVGITFTSGEDLTTFGKGEAIQVFCIVSLTDK